jgi:lipid-binding SYLF domain-containing protein
VVFHLLTLSENKKHTVRGDAPQSDDKYAHKRTQKVPIRIPRKVLEKAEGLAIFTVWRTGLGISAAGGSGIVIARDSPTSWGPPSGILCVFICFLQGFLLGHARSFY